jgi:hypothetical protein
MRVLQTPATPRNALFLPYKEGAAGSNPASPTWEKQERASSRKPSHKRGPERSNSGPLFALCALLLIYSWFFKED